jgi:uncharacterized C2H2 Zn-finger protein
MNIQGDIRCGRCDRWLNYVHDTDAETGTRLVKVMVCEPCMNELVQKELDVRGLLQCPACNRLFRSRKGLAKHIAWCKCTHCEHWRPGGSYYRICGLGKWALVDLESRTPPPKGCEKFVKARSVK